MDKLIACTHPGKMGDMLWSIPTVKKLCELLNTKADFYTSSYCAPLKRLIEYQPYIHEFYVPPNYKIERMDMGVQPIYVPVDKSLYRTVYHFGFRRVPDRAIPEFIAYEAGIGNIDPITFTYPDIETLQEPYYVLAPRGETSFKQLFLDFIKTSQYPVVVVGSNGDAIGKGIDITGTDFLETAAWIAKSKGFVGLMSSQLVIANAFSIPKISPHDGKSWDMRHVVRTKLNYYIIPNSAQDFHDIFNRYE